MLDSANTGEARPSPRQRPSTKSSRVAARKLVSAYRRGRLMRRLSDAVVASLALVGLSMPLAAPHLSGPKYLSQPIRAERGLRVLPADTPTVWTGWKTVRAQRGTAPQWAVALAARAHHSPHDFNGAAPRVALAQAPLWSPYLARAQRLGSPTTPSALPTPPDEPLVFATGPELAPSPSARPARVVSLAFTADLLKLEQEAAQEARHEASYIETSSIVSAPAHKAPIMLVLTALGVNDAATKRAFAELPRNVAFAVAPIAEDPGALISQARAQGRLALLEAPMEPRRYPRVNPGPLTLLRSAAPAQNLDKLDRIFALAPKADGLSIYLGEAFLADKDALAPVAAYLAKRGALVLEPAPGPNSHLPQLAQEHGLHLMRGAISLDGQGALTDISKRLDALVKRAKRDGGVVGVGLAIPSTIDALAKWTRTLDSLGVKLVPLSRMLN